MSVKNYSNTVDLEKMGIPKIEKEIVAISSKTLPEVSGDDNGKMLMVVSGAWAVVDLDGNNDEF